MGKSTNIYLNLLTYVDVNKVIGTDIYQTNGDYL